MLEVSSAAIQQTILLIHLGEGLEKEVLGYCCYQTMLGECLRQEMLEALLLDRAG